MAFADQLLLPTAATGGLDLPRAARALTLGPSALDETSTTTPDSQENPKANGLVSRLGMLFQSTKKTGKSGEAAKLPPIVFPLPTSDSQNRIANLLLRQNYPAIVTEGPPGKVLTHILLHVSHDPV